MGCPFVQLRRDLRGNFTSAGSRNFHLTQNLDKTDCLCQVGLSNAENATEVPAAFPVPERSVRMGSGGAVFRSGIGSIPQQTEETLLLRGRVAPTSIGRCLCLNPSSPSSVQGRELGFGILRTVER